MLWVNTAGNLGERTQEMDPLIPKKCGVIVGTLDPAPYQLLDTLGTNCAPDT